MIKIGKKEYWFMKAVQDKELNITLIQRYINQRQRKKRGIYYSQRIFKKLMNAGLVKSRKDIRKRITSLTKEGKLLLKTIERLGWNKTKNE